MFKWKLTLGLWLVGFVFAMLNGIFGALVVEPNYGPQANHIAKTAFAVLFFFLIIGWTHARFTQGPRPMRAAVLSGSIWVVATALIEIPLSLFLRGWTWQQTINKTLRSYEIWNGQLWILVLLALFIGPVFWAWYLQKNQE